MPSLAALYKAARHDPRLATMVQIWFGAFGSQHKKVKDLLREAPAPLMELFLRFGHEPENRHHISNLRLGRFLAFLVRSPPIMGLQMTSRQQNRQAFFALLDADDAPSTALVARPGKPFMVPHVMPMQPAPGASPPPIPSDVPDEHVMEYGLALAKANLADAIRSQDLALIHDAEERLTMVAAAVDRAGWSPTEWHRFFGNKGKLWL